MKPIVQRVHLSLDLPDSDNKTAEFERILSALKYNPVSAPLSILKNLPSELRNYNYNISLALASYKNGYEIISLNPLKIYGVALDMGTTNLTGRIVNLDSGALLAEAEMENPQREFGSDVLTRVHHAMLNGVDGLLESLIKGINSLIEILCNKCQCCQKDIMALSAAGNTIMTHFLLGLPVDHIPVAPYIPVIHSPGFLKASKLGIEINREAPLYLFPNVGSYVGGDIVSGIFASRIFESSLPKALIDVGTNAEIVIGTDEWMIVSAGAAGPALEEGIAHIGRKAERGSINSVSIDKNTFLPMIQTIENSTPTGICDSGMISLIAALFEAQIIDQRGNFSIGKTGVINHNGETGYLIYEENSRELILLQREVHNFLSSKAGMLTSIYVLTKAVGLSFNDIETFYITGALGSGISVQEAKKIGLLPDLPDNRFISLKNSSLEGAMLLLMEVERLEEIKKITDLITYKEMNEDGDFMKEFSSAKYIPHADPSVLKGN